jgi:hypothetical protein
MEEDFRFFRYSLGFRLMDGKRAFRSLYTSLAPGISCAAADGIGLFK